MLSSDNNMRGYTLVLLLISYLSTAFAHIEMIHPYAINSKYDPQTLEANKDYTMTAPLLANGANYPCKGYNTPSAYSSLNSVDTLISGTNYAVNLAGSAVHGGGSCQFSVSYDQGKTFAVIASIIGGCPIGLTFTIPIPNLPSAKKATFAWTWYNLVGNREEYQNCAIVDIQGPTEVKSYTGPSIYRANTFADGSCITVEGSEVVFPNPGPSVQYLGSSNANTPATVLVNCAYDEDDTVTIAPTGSSISSLTSTTTTSTTTKTSSASTSTSTSTTPSKTSTSASTTSTSRSTTTSPSSTETSTSLKSSATPTSSKSKTTTSTKSKSTKTSTTTTKRTTVTLTTTTSTTISTKKTTTKPTTTTSSPSPTSTAAYNLQTPYLKCNTAKTWSLCITNGDSSQDQCTFMGSVAAGTKCQDGQIVMA